MNQLMREKFEAALDSDQLVIVKKKHLTLLISAAQLACRHPHFPNSPALQITKQYCVEELQHKVSEGDPDIEEVFRLGWEQ